MAPSLGKIPKILSTVQGSWPGGAGWGWHDTGQIAPQDQWTHVAVVFDRGMVTTYINGVAKETWNSGTRPSVT
jgi:hypothetical protein